MAVSLNSEEIFGSYTKVIGPTSSYRSQRELLPGVDGYRTYRLGKGPLVWTVRGRLTNATLAGLVGVLNSAQAYKDGQLYTFVDNSGSGYSNCLLTSYQQDGPIQWSSAGYTVTISATVECVSPT